MIIGSSTLPVMMSFNFGRVDGITTTTEAASPTLDYYRALWKFDIHNYSMNWVPNKVSITEYLSAHRDKQTGRQAHRQTHR
jgi:hypothetical protein